MYIYYFGHVYIFVFVLMYKHCCKLQAEEKMLYHCYDYFSCFRVVTPALELL